MRHWWTTVIAALLMTSVTSFAQGPDLAGDWRGTLKAGLVELRLILHVVKRADGSLGATLDSIDQGATAIPVSSIALRETLVSFAVEAIQPSSHSATHRTPTYSVATSKGRSLSISR